MTRPEWFAERRWGYGAGLPIAWQGWAVSFAYAALIYLASIWLDPPSVAFWGALAVLTAGFATVTYFTTRGRWRLRSGADD